MGISGFPYEKPISDISSPEEEEWFLALESLVEQSKARDKVIAENKNGTTKTKLDSDREAFIPRGNEEYTREYITASDCDCGYKDKSVPLRSHSDWCTYAKHRRNTK